MHSAGLQDKGILHFKNITDHIKHWLPNAGVGANYSPTSFVNSLDPTDLQSQCVAYVGQAFQWVRNFREGGSTMPWAEDWQACAAFIFGPCIQRRLTRNRRLCSGRLHSGPNKWRR